MEGGAYLETADGTVRLRSPSLHFCATIAVVLFVGYVLLWVVPTSPAIKFGISVDYALLHEMLIVVAIGIGISMVYVSSRKIPFAVTIANALSAGYVSWSFDAPWAGATKKHIKHKKNSGAGAV